MSRKYKQDHIKRYMNAVASIGCIICGAPAQIHHIRTELNSKSDLLILPLCPYHHTDGPSGDAIHNGKFEFRCLYGTEFSLLAKVLDNIARRIK